MRIILLRRKLSSNWRSWRGTATGLVVLLSLVQACAFLPMNRSPSGESLKGETMKIWAHRGASGIASEHSLEAYTKAIEQGADAIELDLVLTQDKALIVRHENELSDTTNVADVYPGRKRTKIIEGKTITGWFSEDFSLKEIKILRLKKRGARNDQITSERVLTFHEVLDFLLKANQKPGPKTVGILVELKHPSYFRSAGFWIEDQFVKELRRFLDENPESWSPGSAPFWVQCFERQSLENLKKRFSSWKKIDIKLLQLIGDLDTPLPEEVAAGLKSGQERFTLYRDLVDPEEMGRVREYADGFGFAKSHVFENSAVARLSKSGPESPVATGLVHLAHRNGLEVHVYTFRRENVSSRGGAADFLSEYYPYIRLGVDGVFTNYPEDGVQALFEYSKGKDEKD